MYTTADGGGRGGHWQCYKLRAQRKVDGRHGHVGPALRAMADSISSRAGGTPVNSVPPKAAACRRGQQSSGGQSNHPDREGEGAAETGSDGSCKEEAAEEAIQPASEFSRLEMRSFQEAVHGY